MTGTLKKKLHLLPSLLMCLLAHAQQSTYSYPDFFQSTYPFLISYDNPGYIVEDTRYNLYSQYKQRLGQFKKITSYSVLAEKIWRREEKNTNSVKIILNNENEGPHIARPRFQLGYANELTIKDDVKIALGFNLGATAINFSAPNQGASGNSYLPDGKLGFVLKLKQLEAGIATLQFLNSKSRVISSNISLARYYHAFVKYKKNFGFDWSLEGIALADLRPTNAYLLQIGAMATYRERLSFGLSNRFNDVFSVFGKIRFFDENIPINFIFMYNSPAFSNSIKGFQSVEIAISVGIL